MATFRAYAKVLEADDPSIRIYEAGLTSDAGLLAIAELSEVPVSLEHLRGLDPQTRIMVRAELLYEGARLSRFDAERPPAIATVLPDGRVIAGDPSPEDLRPWRQDMDGG